MGFIFRFSCKAGTTAEKIDPKIQQEEIVKRFNYAKKMLKENNYKVLTLTKNSFYTFYKKRFYSKYKKRYKIPKRD